MSKEYVKVLNTATLEETVKLIVENRQSCALVVDDDDLLEGILTLGDVQRGLSKASNGSRGDAAVVAVCS